MVPVVVQISVRDLIGFALRSGDLVRDFVTASRAVEGTRGHQYVQGHRPEGYEAEVRVSFLYESDPVSLEITGRADGVLLDDDGLLVEEIKTTYGALDRDREDNPHHWAQAKTYAYILAVLHEVPTVDVQLTYVQLGSSELLEDRRTFPLAELATYFEEIVARYLKWERAYRHYCHERDLSIADLDFPFPHFRPGQEELSACLADTIAADGRLFAEAPTGIGKTISVLFPAVKAIGAGQAQKIFFLTAKTSGRAVAEKAIDDMRRTGLKFKSVTLTARDRICFNARDGRPCDVQTCEYARGYYDRINDAIDEAFALTAATRSAIETVARKHMVCPFELGLDLSLWADAIICDYNYVFDPKAYLRRYFLDARGDYVFLIDEAHNLVERARDMYSAELHKTDILKLKKALAGDHPHLAKALDAINSYLLDLSKRCEDEGDGQSWLSRESPEDLLYLLERLRAILEPILSRNRPTPYHQDLLECFYNAVGFLRVAEAFDERYVTCAERSGRDLRLRLYCLDPSIQIREALKRGKTAAFFSATLTPLDYFRDLLGGDRGDFTVALGSPFPDEHLALLVADHIDTTYRGRQFSFDEVAQSIAATVRARRGNYIAYFPSYRYLEEVYSRFLSAAGSVRTLVQRRRMSEAEREQFLTCFADDNSETVVGFAVMGGIFGEGIDLVGERLVGAIIVGVGLPQICLERDLIRGYFDERSLSGFAYAYTYPGMNRVLQAAGRVIRSDADRGLILLIDRRFGQEQYRELFPGHWNNPNSTRGSDQISAVATAFWKNSQ